MQISCGVMCIGAKDILPHPTHIKYEDEVLKIKIHSAQSPIWPLYQLTTAGKKGDCIAINIK